MSESHVTWPTSVPILVFLGLSVLELGPMYAITRQTDVRLASSRNASTLWGRGHYIGVVYYSNGDLTLTLSPSLTEDRVDV